MKKTAGGIKLFPRGNDPDNDTMRAANCVRLKAWEGCQSFMKAGMASAR